LVEEGEGRIRETRDEMVRSLEAVLWIRIRIILVTWIRIGIRISIK
jgi:hypothetical protein